jgi:hypothetical protein
MYGAIIQLQKARRISTQDEIPSDHEGHDDEDGEENHGLLSRKRIYA